MKYRIIGFTDSVNECDCCGKTDLKGTYVMADEMDNELYFGVVCGAKANGQSVEELKNGLKKIKLEAELSELVKNANSQYLKNQLLKFISKKKVDLVSFLKSNGEVIEVINDFTVYRYGSNCFNINN